MGGWRCRSEIWLSSREACRVSPNDQGKYRHGLFSVNVNGQTHTCAVDVDTKSGTEPVHWIVLNLRPAEWQSLTDQPDGWYPLNRAPGDGSIDYIRDDRLFGRVRIPDLVDPFWKFKRINWFQRIIQRAACLPNIEIDMLGEAQDGVSRSQQMRIARQFVFFHRAWHATQSEQALAALESIFGAEPNCRMMFFGSFFNNGFGVHNIHQNQGNYPPTPGDPDYSVKQGHFLANGVWQDGMTAALRGKGQIVAFLNKFAAQSDHTDANGNGI